MCFSETSAFPVVSENFSKNLWFVDNFLNVFNRHNLVKSINVDILWISQKVPLKLKKALNKHGQRAILILLKISPTEGNVRS
jgi:hypothetical protein